MSEILTQEDFEKSNIEEIIHGMDGDELMANLHAIRKRFLDDPSYQASEQELAGCILLTRSLRAMRETGKKTTAKKTPKADAPLDSLLDGL